MHAQQVAEAARNAMRRSDSASKALGMQVTAIRSGGAALCMAVGVRPCP